MHATGAPAGRDRGAMLLAQPALCADPGHSQDHLGVHLRVHLPSKHLHHPQRAGVQSHFVVVGG